MELVYFSTFKGTEAYETDCAESFWIEDWSNLNTIITEKLWCPAIFKLTHWTDARARNRIGMRRLNSNLEKMNLLVVDIDAGCSIEEAKRIFAPYRALIGTSKSHQKLKNDVVCDRFRVIIPMSEKIESDADFKATWFEVQKLCPAIDPACKDAARFYFPCTEIVAEWDGALFPVKRAVKATPVAASGPLVIAQQNQQLAPSVRTMKFIAMGAEPGAWHSELVAACYDLKQQLWTKESAVAKLTKVTGLLDEHDMGVIEDVWANREPRHPPRVSTSDALKKLILKCHLIADILDPANIVMADLKSGKVHAMHKETIRQELTRDEFASFMNQRSIRAYFTYDPHLTKPLTTDADDVFVYNQFVPPFWRADNYYHGTTLVQEAEMPALMREFLEHLTANHKESFEYLLDWLATSLQSRNYTILTAIGEEGIGKGTLGAIMQKLHGDKNFQDGSDAVFKERFNGKLENKSLVYIDEIALKTKESQDRIKAVVNDYIEIEKKGVDAITSRNHASFYISSNHLDAIRLGARDRRYSIIDLTNVQMMDTKFRNSHEELRSDETVSQFARYLYFRKPVNDMMRPFRSKRFEMVKFHGLSPWEEYFLCEYIPEMAGSNPTLRDAQEKVVNEGYCRYKPSRRAFEMLSKKYPNMFTVKHLRRGSSERFLEIPRELKGVPFGDLSE